MSKVIQFPNGVPMTTIDEAHFEKYADAALILKCFEVVKDAIEVIGEPEYPIGMGDDTYIAMIEAFWALKVLFKRKTGHDAAVVAEGHWRAMGQHLLEGAPLPEQTIPIVCAPVSPLPPDAFTGLTTIQLACAGFNYADRVRESIMDHSADALTMATARVNAIDATTALRRLVLQISGGNIESMAAVVLRNSRRNGETLQ